MAKKLLICDLDNTLFFTDKLNSKSYIEAAKQLQIALPRTAYKEARITSSTIKRYCPNIDSETLKHLKQRKLEYFQNNLNDIIVNKSLLKLINRYNYLCFWTSSIKERAVTQCRYFNIDYNELISFNKNSATIEDIENIIIEWSEKYNIKDKKDILIIDDEVDYLKKIESLGYQTLLVEKIV
ncbi:hypothetical protein IKD82_01130 [Candidatus Saccharibacteria bacterium]|nr:hypothetical protein [Candidatus Saccharibacteria bacterium]